ncbi:hypothetical protein ACLJJ6_09755 [Pediococcus siamensis]|uniref:hypothetical protein n=1 Tax=Pediococcus siamensis TaxID=381829 RepID=UPI0039A3F5FD
MQLRLLIYRLLLRNLKAKICLIILQIGLLYEYCQESSFNSAENIFNTFPAMTINFIFQNLNWILYYLVPLSVMIPIFKEFLLKQNVFVWIRKSNSRLPVVLVGGLILVSSVLYNLYFWAVVWIFKIKTISVLFIFRLGLATTLSLIGITILILVLTMLLRGIVGELLTIVLFLIVLALKTNWVILITTTLNLKFVSGILVIWLVILVELLNLTYRKMELL